MSAVRMSTPAARLGRKLLRIVVIAWAVMAFGQLLLALLRGHGFGSAVQLVVGQTWEVVVAVVNLLALVLVVALLGLLVGALVGVVMVGIGASDRVAWRMVRLGAAASGSGLAIQLATFGASPLIVALTFVGTLLSLWGTTRLPEEALGAGRAQAAE
ncbi:hypothetical protein ER308_17480 [Egibacter rhizosphaerae]|uniref:Uncharacterized protein n=1 Tax=Egibacter rhizosphaerae TaxID=1670831 RepID=A0A411YIY3_9ACTN|nr:hypothetical protein [Egibacter rhizosphaerae]QBI21183.1 hypothetical protein ER308_17480 [Egibacter rhizosphaerae]